jgi:hypothetical protein
MAVINCPNCKANNESGPLCRRCKSDLSLLFQAFERRAWTMLQAGISLRNGQLLDCKRYLEEAELIQPGLDIDRMKAVSHLLNRDFAAAASWYTHTIHQTTVARV